MRKGYNDIFRGYLKNMKDNNKGSYWNSYKKDKHRYTVTFTKEENEKLLSDLSTMQVYMDNFNLKVKDVLKKKGLSNRLLSSDELQIEARKVTLLEEIAKQSSKVVEIIRKTTSNINLIARDISCERLEAPETWKLKESQWEGLLQFMNRFEEQSDLFFKNLIRAVQNVIEAKG